MATVMKTEPAMRKYTDYNTQDPADRPTWVDGIDNPYLHGPYTPVVSEITAVDLAVTQGEIPQDLYGAYMRNGPNPVFKPRGAYHWFDGDGMVHGVYFRDGRASYIRKWVQTQALHDEIERGKVELSGVMGPFDMQRIAGRETRVAQSRLLQGHVEHDAEPAQRQAALGLVQRRRRLRARPADARDLRAGDLLRRARHLDERARQGRRADRRVHQLRLRRLPALAHLLRDRRRRQAQAQGAHRPARPAPAARHDDHAALHDPARLPAVPRHRAAEAHRPSRRAVPPRAAVALRRDPALRHAGAGALVRVRAGLRAAHGQCLGGRRLDHDGRLLPAGPDDPPQSRGRPARLDARLPALQGPPAPLAHERRHRREERAADRRPERRVLPARHDAVRRARRATPTTS